MMDAAEESDERVTVNLAEDDGRSQVLARHDAPQVASSKFPSVAEAPPHARASAVDAATGMQSVRMQTTTCAAEPSRCTVDFRLDAAELVEG